MKSNIDLFTAITLSCALLLSPFAAGDDLAPEEIDQIIVSGARTPLTVNQIGSAATIITRAEIERREARHIADLLRSVPGFSVSHTGVAGSQTQIRVRGAEANHILVLIDGIRANDPATGDEFRWEFLSTGNIERIEIIRGPQSSLWGSDAVAAVVHIITQSGRTSSGISGYAEGGSFATSNAGLTAALSGDRWSLRGGIESLDTDGGNISRTGGEKDGSDLSAVDLSLDFAASKSLSLTAGVRAVDAYSQFDPVDFFVTGLPTDGDVATDTQNFYARAGAVWQRDNRHVSHHLNVRYFESANRNLIAGLESSSTASDRLTLAYQADINIGKNVLSLAVEREETQFQQSGAIVFGDPNQTQNIGVNSAIVEFQGLSMGRLTWIISARADNNSDFDDALNGRLSLAYEFSDSTTLRASAGTGQKNPTFTERFGFFPRQFIGNPQLKPETSTSYDIGIDQSLLDDSLQIQVSLFQQNLEEEINGFVFDPMTFLSTAENTAGKSKRSGIELATQWALSDSLATGAHYTYIDSTELNFLGNDVRELRRPKHSGGLSLDFRAANERFDASLNADYGGTRTDIFFAPFPNPSQIVTLGNYWLVDLAARYRVTESVTAFAKASNLLDEDYEQVFGYRTPGRAGFMGVRVSFGKN